jgi:hypothetical protein
MYFILYVLMSQKIHKGNKRMIESLNARQFDTSYGIEAQPQRIAAAPASAFKGAANFQIFAEKTQNIYFNIYSEIVSGKNDQEVSKSTSEYVNQLQKQLNEVQSGKQHAKDGILQWIADEKGNSKTNPGFFGSRASLSEKEQDYKSKALIFLKNQLDANGIRK